MAKLDPEPIPAPEPHLARALDQISRMIVVRLLAPGPLRFAEVERLARVAQDLERAVGTRVESFPTSTIGQRGEYHVGEGQPVLPGRFTNMNDVNEVNREVMMALQALTDQTGGSFDARNARDEATELATLLELPADAQVGVQARINELKARINARAGKDNDNAVVPPDVLRGHSPGANREEDDAPGAGGAQPDGEGSGDEAPGNGAGAPVAGHAVVRP